MTTFLQRRATLVYFGLVIAISWAGMSAVVGPANFPLEWERFERLGAALYVVALAGPVSASLLLTGLLDGRAGFRELFARLRRRVSVRWHGVAVLPGVAMAATFLGLPLVSEAFIPSIFTADDKLQTVFLGIAVGLLFGVFEELGWTGFAVPRLRRQHGIFSTGIIIGLVWGTWHFPLFWQADSFAAVVPFVLLLVRLFSWLLPFRILLVWIHDRSRSLLLPMLMHACVSAVAVVFITSDATTGLDLWTVTLAWPLVMWSFVGLVVVTNHGHLTRSIPDAANAPDELAATWYGARSRTSQDVSAGR